MLKLNSPMQAGRIKAGTSGDSFIGEQHDKMVRQLRDLVQEQQSIQRLQLLVKSLKWVKDLSYDQQLKLDKQRLDSMVFAFYGDWIKQLMPINQIELMGWQIKHLENSPFNLQYVENLNISITESEGQQDWFNIGATVQDSAGNSYNLLDALVALVRVNPDLLDPRTFIHLHDSQIFTVKTALINLIWRYPLGILSRYCCICRAFYSKKSAVLIAMMRVNY